MKGRPHFLALAALALCLATQAAAQVLLEFSAEEKARIAAHGPWPVAAPRDASNRADGKAAAVARGRQLFFDPRLSADGRRGCATCHQSARHFQDGRATPAPLHAATTPGPVALQKAHRGQRNTPGLGGTAVQRWWGWDGAHDSLWSASLTPLLAADEMGHSLQSLAQRLRQSADLAHGYRRVYDQPLPADDEHLAVDVAKALAAYQATLTLPRTPFDAFRDALEKGDHRQAARYPLAAQRGLRIFIGQGRCFFCHSGPNFSNGEFADVGVPFFVPGGVDAGRHVGLLALQSSRYTRLGPYSDAPRRDAAAVFTRHVVLEPRHFGEFKVPSLRQLVHSAPYMHNGSLATLKDVVRHYSEINEDRLHADGERIVRRLNLSAAELADLQAFLRSLSLSR